MILGKDRRNFTHSPKLQNQDLLKTHNFDTHSLLRLLVLLYGTYLFGCVPQTPTVNLPPAEPRQRGAHVFGITDSTDFRRIQDLNVEWVTLVPWGFQPAYDSPKVSHHAGDSTRRRAHDEHWIERIRQVRGAGFQVFLKPHVWIHDDSTGKWRSDIFPRNDTDWQQWQDTYRDFILRYAGVAERAGAEMFCIGVEFSRLSTEKPDYWRRLIREVRTVYSGRLTYAANWYREYEDIEFWPELDYIGVQAYFPLSDRSDPNRETLLRGWEKHLNALESTAHRTGKRVVFTELGYRSTATAAIEPWSWMEHAAENEESYAPQLQARCYEVFFEAVWTQAWFAGAHFWQFRADGRGEDNNYNLLDFTPLNKPAAEVLRRAFGAEEER